MGDIICTAKVSSISDPLYYFNIYFVGKAPPLFINPSNSIPSFTKF